MFLRVGITKCCTWSRLDTNHCAQCIKYCACAYKRKPKHDESEALDRSIFIKWHHSAAVYIISMKM